MNRTCILDESIYPAECVDVAEQEFVELCTVARMRVNSGLQLTITTNFGAPTETADEFLNFVLSAALERHLSV